MDIASITATITGLKAASDIVNGLMNAKTSSAVDTAVRELNAHLLTVQREAMAANTEQFTMIEEIRALKKEIAHIKAWDSEKKRYQLTDLWNTGVLAYALKESMSNAEPPHYLCTNCYEEGRKRILNLQKNSKSGRLMLVCPFCKTEFHSMYSRDLPVKYV